MSVKLSPVGNSQIIDANGNPASNWKIYTYQAGSSSAQATYTSDDGSAAQANPIVLNALGRPANPIWLTAGQAYKFVVKDANDVDQFTIDDVSGINDASISTSQWQASGVTPTYVSAGSFTLSGDQTSDFHVGRRLQFTVASGSVYGTITNAAYTSLTTVTVGMDPGNALDAGLSAVNLSILRATPNAMPVPTRVSPQRLINGGAEVATRFGRVISLSTSPQYGQVDMCALWASGGAVSAGGLQQITTASVGRTGKAARIAGATLTGSGQLSWRYRMEAKDAVKLKNQLVSFQIGVLHDVGGNVNYTIIIRKPSAADNFTSTTVISTGAATAVTSGAPTVLTAQAVSVGDCSVGLEIEVQVACGAVTTKNFDFTEWQLEEGAICTGFERRDYADEERRCRRYLPAFFSSSSFSLVGDGVANSTTTFRASTRFDVPARVPPTGLSVDADAHFSVNDGVSNFAGTATAISSLVSTTGAAVSVTVTGTLTQYRPGSLYFNNAAGRLIFTGCEL